MTNAQFIDIFLTPVASGIAGMVGMRFVLRRQPDAPYSAVMRRWMPVCVGAGVFIILFTKKLLGGI